MAGRFHLFRHPPAALAALPAAVAAVWPGLAPTQQPSSPRSGAPPYVVACTEPDPDSAPSCSADLTTYIGWRVFDRYCAECHGEDAEGSAFAPSLVLRLQRFDRRAFDRALDEGYTGPFAPLRPWGEHPQVAQFYDELWAFLSARRDGELPPVPLRPRNERPAEPRAE